MSLNASTGHAATHRPHLRHASDTWIELPVTSMAPTGHTSTQRMQADGSDVRQLTHEVVLARGRHL